MDILQAQPTLVARSGRLVHRARIGYHSGMEKRAKRHGPALLLAPIALLLAVQAGAAATLDRVRAGGTFTIAYRADAAPYSYRSERGEPAGYIVDLCREVAGAVRDRLGIDLKVVYLVVTADQRFEAIRDGRADILCDPSSVTLERRETIDFSIPTFLDGAGVVSRDARPVERFEDLAGKRVGVLSATTTERVLRGALADLRIDAAVTTVRDHRNGIELLAADRIDAYFGDRAILASFLSKQPMPGFRLARQYFSYETYALALPRDDSVFRLLVDRTLARLYRSGRIRTLMTRAFGPFKLDELLNALFVINSLPER
jgi:ABC-type amino acid transport substrate-binding protein